MTPKIRDLGASFPLFLLLLGGPAALTAPSAQDDAPSSDFSGDVHWMTLQQTIDPVSAEFFKSSLDRARRDGAGLFVVELDTPGGLDASMREIIKATLGSEVPVVVYVAPSGSRAASAGVFITLAAHVAAMAPGTNIGAAHPVSLGSGGEMDTVMTAKVTNDAVAYIRSLAEGSGRNADWAEEAVRRSASLSAEDALQQNVIDLVAGNAVALLDSLDGRVVRTEFREGFLRTRGAARVEIRMGWRERVLSLISNPNVAYVLFLLGLMGLFFELSNPGSILPGILGSICIILAFFAFQTLPVSAAGILLILLAIVLFILEIKVTSYGGLTIGGVVSLILGSLMLFRSPAPSLRVSLEVLIPAVAATVAFFVFAIGMGLRAQRRRKVSGSEGLLGERGVVRIAVGPGRAGGKVFVHGEIWSAVSAAEAAEGTPVRVTAVDGLRLRVEPVSEEA